MVPGRRAALTSRVIVMFDKHAGGRSWADKRNACIALRIWRTHVFFFQSCSVEARLYYSAQVPIGSANLQAFSLGQGNRENTRVHGNPGTYVHSYVSEAREKKNNKTQHFFFSDY